jgi:alanyl-tRNA synthetase
MIAVRSDFIDSNKILQELFKIYEGKGGGNKLLAQGSIKSDEKIFDKAKKIVLSEIS